MSGHQKVLSVDAENLTVRAEAGAIWENIDREIGMQGLALRLYPSSYPELIGCRLARTGRLRVRQLRVRHLQGQRHRRSRRVADR